METTDIQQSHISVKTIQNLICTYYGCSSDLLLSERRYRDIARPRQVGMWLSKKYTTRSLPDIAHRFRRDDHTTALHAVKKINAIIAGEDKSTLKERPSIIAAIETLSSCLIGNAELVTSLCPTPMLTGEPRPQPKLVLIQGGHQLAF